jgi:hypothetical protein
VETVGEVCGGGGLGWFGRVEGRGGGDWVRWCADLVVGGERPGGGPGSAWEDVVGGGGCV